MIRNSAVNNTCITCHFNIYRYDDQTVYIYIYIYVIGTVSSRITLLASFSSFQIF